MPSGFPVTLSEIGLPVRPVEANAPLMTVATNGMGTPIVISDNGAPFIVDGLVPPLPEMSVIFTQPGNLIYPADISNAPEWFTPNSFWIGTEGSPSSVLMQYSGTRWEPLQGEITDETGRRQLQQLGNLAMCTYTNSVPATYP